MTAPALINQLKAIHPPASPSWWPLAPGWYLLFLIALVFCFLIGKLVYSKLRKLRRKRMALTLLSQLEKKYQQQANTAYLAKATVLLKQVLLTSYSREHIAKLHNENLLAFLDDLIGSNEYSQGVGRLLLTAPYESQNDTAHNLFALLRKTFKRCL